MTITAGVQRQFFGDDLPIIPSQIHRKQVIRLPPASSTPTSSSATYSSTRKGSPWTDEEHERFLTGLEMYPRGPWKLIAQIVATRTTRQTMTHAQKYRQRIARHTRQHGDAIHTPSPNATTKRQDLGETSRRRPSPRPNRRNDGSPSSTTATTRKRTRKKAPTVVIPMVAAGSGREPTTDQLPPELVAMEWLLAVHPEDWERDGNDNAGFTNARHV